MELCPQAFKDYTLSAQLKLPVEIFSINKIWHMHMTQEFFTNIQVQICIPEKSISLISKRSNHG
jgi:hypothetical protein